MPAKFGLYFCTITLLIVTNIAVNIFFHAVHLAGPTAAITSYSSPPVMKIVLLPLDSRPACTSFVRELGRIARAEIILPPQEYLDNYNTPADRQALRSWLKNAVRDADAAIISGDMLIHGSLVSSRLALGTENDLMVVQKLLQDIHAEFPQTKLYVFNIIPRLLVAADNNEYNKYQKKMVTYSTLKDKINIFENPSDIKQLAELKQSLPPTVITRYSNLYKQNLNTNLQLIKLVETGVVSDLIIGQDDGQPFGMPNINRVRLQNYLDNHPQLTGKVNITRGTDEVALTILGRILLQQINFRPKIFVTYSYPASAQIVMPYMPNSVAKTVQEKIALINGQPVDSPDKADFILFVHVGTSDKNNITYAANYLKNLLDTGYKVALVDLAKDFQASQTILPELVRTDVDIPRLIAYASWNTTSNSIGTAVTQAALVVQAAQAYHTKPEIISAYSANLQFLTARLLDDWYFQKEVQPLINSGLALFHIDNYHLGENYWVTNRLSQNFMELKAGQLLREIYLNHPVTIVTGPAPADKIKLALTNLTIESRFPWDRTFELEVKPTLSIVNYTE